MGKMIRVHKFLADNGVASRRKSEEMVAAGVVTVNGKPATVGRKIDPAVDKVVVNGRQIGATTEKVYLMFYKPRGVTTSMEDRYAKKTVRDFLPPNTPRVFPVGRLDKESEGLLILTNDGDLALRLTHPKFHHEKEYEVVVQKRLTESDIAKLRHGVRDHYTDLTAQSIESIGPRSLRIVLTKGKKNHIRRMMRVIGHNVQSLKRIRIGSLYLGNLKPGEMKEISGKKLTFKG